METTTVLSPLTRVLSYSSPSHVDRSHTLPYDVRPSQDEQLADEDPQPIRQQTEDVAKQFLPTEATEEVKLVRKLTCEAFIRVQS